METLVSETRRVWIPDHPTLAYAPGRVEESLEDGRLLVVDDNGEQFHIAQDQAESVDPACLQGVEDLLLLGDFNEAALLHDIRARYSEDKIYTSIGSPILISVNPYQKIANLYSTETQTKYRQAASTDRDRGGPPVHVYSVADAAYKAMLKDQSNQSIIISGESGAGKTEATKRVLAYLAEMQRSTYGSDASRPGGERTVEQQVLDANPVLEAFGNAKTVRNDNSSRFGKFVEVEFDATGRLLSAQISNYLLEKCRIVTQQPEERNYHIFYQLCAACEQGLPGCPEGLRLGSALDFEYTQICDRVQGVDDAAEFADVVGCMTSLGFTVEERESSLRVVAGVLHLGNLTFSSCTRDNQDGVAIDGEDKVGLICGLFGLESEQLHSTLENHTLVDPLTKKTIHRPHDLKSASFTRHSMAKVVFARLFDWLVCRINESMARDHGKAKRDLKRIGLLDIYGFEVFECNSFEQLCINFANEKLQCHFNKHMFALEQGLYSSEGISWSHITFQDNQPIIDTLDKKPLGLFCLVDSECMMPSATDATLLGKVHNTYKSSKIIYKPSRFNTPEFAVAHYAGEVVYTVDTFIEKNTDKLHADVVNLFKASTDELLKSLFTDPRYTSGGVSSTEGPKASGGSQRSRTPVGRRRASSGQEETSTRQRQNVTVSMMFREQLDKLVEDLNRTNPRYVRCVKPNANKMPREFDSADVLRQLRCAGMLESIRIRRAGYAVRRPFKEFFNRFRLLAPHLAASGPDPDYRTLCQRLATSVDGRLQAQGARIEEKSWQVGQTRFFMREDLERHYERLLVDNAKSHVITLQKRVRGFLRRRRFLALRRAAEDVQCALRTRRAVVEYEEAKRRRAAAFALQSALRMAAARTVFVRRRQAVLCVQRFVRGWRCRRRMGNIRSKAAAEKVRKLREEEEREEALRQARREAKEKEEALEAMRKEQEEQARAMREQVEASTREQLEMSKVDMTFATAAAPEELERLQDENRKLTARLQAADEMNSTRNVSRFSADNPTAVEGNVAELMEELQRLRDSKHTLEEDLLRATSSKADAERRAQAAEDRLTQAKSADKLENTLALDSLRSEILARIEDKPSAHFADPIGASIPSGPLGSSLRSHSNLNPAIASALRPISEDAGKVGMGGVGDRVGSPAIPPTDGGSRLSMQPGGRNTIMNQRQLFETLKQQFAEAQDTGADDAPPGEVSEFCGVEVSELARLEEEIRRLQLENAKLKTGMLSSQEDTINRAYQADELVAEVSKLQAELEDERIRNKSTVSTMRLELEDSLATMLQQKEDIERLNSRLVGAEARGGQLPEEEIERQRNILQKERAELQSRFGEGAAETHRELLRLQGDLRAKENELVNVKRVLDDVVSAHAPLDELHKWKARAEQAEQKYHQVMQYNREMTSAVGHLTQAASDRSGDRSQLQQQVQVLQQEQARREQEARRAELEKQELKKDLDNVQSSCSYFQGKYKSTAAELKAAQKEHATAAEGAAQARSRAAQASRDAEALKGQVATLRQQLSESYGRIKGSHQCLEVINECLNTLVKLHQDHINLHEQNARIQDESLRRQAHEKRDRALSVAKRAKALIAEVAEGSRGAEPQRPQQGAQVSASSSSHRASGYPQQQQQQPSQQHQHSQQHPQHREHPQQHSNQYSREQPPQPHHGNQYSREQLQQQQAREQQLQQQKLQQQQQQLAREQQLSQERAPRENITGRASLLTQLGRPNFGGGSR